MSGHGVPSYEEFERNSGVYDYYPRHGRGIIWGHMYKTDFSTYEPRKYREDNGVVVYENGTVEIQVRPYGSPRRRQYLKDEYNVEFRLKTDTAGITFFTPDGAPVRKNSIKECMFFLDYNHGMALAGFGGYENLYKPIRYYGPNARPMSQRVLRCKQYNPRQAKELYTALTYYTLSDRPHSPSPIDIKTWLGKVASGATPPIASPDNDDGAYRLLQLGFMQAHKTLTHMLNEATATMADFPFLYFKVR